MEMFHVASTLKALKIQLFEELIVLMVLVLIPIINQEVNLVPQQDNVEQLPIQNEK
ncbi:hypothetical protein J1N35_001314 [Gossypium stocksii]|uniref:Uncharacterized protein n=1 Tax=Gossypium stocksii TaxID=47602 RepID=A0A9D3WK59_9ROSI|nr:hypothetical protein J1N35_001314 [Gossypium stocksii]